MKEPISKIQARDCCQLPLIVISPQTKKPTLNFGGKTLKTFAIALLLSVAGTTSAFADLLTLSAVTPGSSGSFTGTLDGIAVNGSITTTTPNFTFSPAVSANPNFPDSTINDTSPQYSYSNIYAVSAPLADQVGYVTLTGTQNLATITISFGTAVLNPIFQVANLDGMQYDFTHTIGLTGLDLLSGNGGGGDGILVTDDVISDADPTTVVAQAPDAAPFTTGARSAYGSVELLGSFTTLTIDVSNFDNQGTYEGDGGSFTLATTVPEPWSFTLFATMCGILALCMRRRLARVQRLSEEHTEITKER
jgi:hypothetical protein